MVPERDSQCASRTELPRPSRTLRQDWPRQCHICAGTGRANATSAPGLASPVPRQCHVCVGTRRTAATDVQGLGVEWPSSHLSARLPYAGASYLTTSRNPSVTICTTSADASGPSFTPSTTYIAARTAPPPSSDSTVTGVRRYLSGCPAKRSECSSVFIDVNCYSSPPICGRLWDEFTHRTPAANIAYLALVLPCST
jgi:hypothetical protein